MPPSLGLNIATGSIKIAAERSPPIGDTKKAILACENRAENNGVKSCCRLLIAFPLNSAIIPLQSNLSRLDSIFKVFKSGWLGGGRERLRLDQREGGSGRRVGPPGPKTKAQPTGSCYQHRARFPTSSAATSTTAAK
jgi:hypothetical protein